MKEFIDPHKMKEYFDKHEEFVLLPYSDFQKLKSIAEMRQNESITMINTEDLLFLSALVDYYCKQGNVYLEIYKNTVTLHVSYYEEEIINSSFSLDICKKYYNNISKFIGEVL